VPGLGIPWAITRDRELRRQLVLRKFNTIVSCPRIDEALALRAFERRAVILDERRCCSMPACSAPPPGCANSGHVEWVRPDAGAIRCIRLRPSAFD